MELLEIIRTKKVSDQVLLDCLEYGKKIKKTCVVVSNRPGFAVNRIFYPYCSSSGFLAQNGVSPYRYYNFLNNNRIDNVLKEKFKMPMGPFRLYDMTGVDVIEKVSQILRKEYSELSYPVNYLTELVKNNRLGEKKGKGTYIYDNGKALVDKDISNFIKLDKKTYINSDSITDDEIIEICIYPCINEALKIVGEKSCYDPSHLDVASCLGMGFPKF
jgi:enoyl-CoA hydratase/3-hydroxyacyl-CoA dehydrogenase